MANPQKENGYTKIANELYDAIIRWHFSSYEYRVLIFILRKTYGWNKKTDKIALSQFVQATMIKKSHISRTLTLLVKQNVITKGGNRAMREWSIQKDYDKWKKLPIGERSHHKLVTKGGNKKIVPKGVIQIVKGGNSVVSKGGTTKETITKDNTTKEREQLPPATTPSDEARDFFSKGESYRKTSIWLKTKTPDEKLIDTELNKFILYWTEKNSTGKKERWQMEKTFEIRRRLATWLSRVKQFSGIKRFEDTQAVDNFANK